MSNVAKVLKDEISRISRKEAKSHVAPIGKSQTALKKTVADLKRRIALLERENKRLVKETQTGKAVTPPALSEETEKARITSKSISSLRNRLGLTQSDFAKLVGVTTHAVYLWENKEGALKLRDKTKAAILSVRGFGAKAAKEKLTGGETKE